MGDPIMGRLLHIALLIESSRYYGRMLLDGVADYARTFGPWTFYHGERSIDDPAPVRLRQWKPDGVIGRFVNRAQAEFVRRLGVPSIDVLGELADARIPQVVPDQASVVRAAVDHLLSRGLRQLAYVGFNDVRFSMDRRDLFLQYAKEKGCWTDVFQDRGLGPAVGLARKEEKTFGHGKALGGWLRGLPKPVGLMACNDMRAYQALSVCRECGIAVPDEIAIIGVDDDPVLCKLSSPPLSSVDPNAHRIGYEAASLMQRMIEGRRPAAAVTRVQAASVVARQSTDAVAMADADLTAAVRQIRERACEGLTTDDLVEQLAVSRSTLYRWFDRHLGHSPGEEITRVKLNRVKELLATTGLSIEKIAELAGFEFTESMHRLFRKRFGQPPGAYRAVHRRFETR
jgi:LacI family transcriptional regulator